VRILAKINGLLGGDSSLAIADIHFSTAKWATQQQTIAQAKVVMEDHPSYLPAIASSAPKANHKPHLKLNKIDLPIPKPPENASEAFQRWQTVMKLRTNQLPTCPRCDRPALIGEISRWQMCRVCAIESLFN
jgi:predicted nucleic acid-binding Zn ribbon protein